MCLCRIFQGKHLVNNRFYLACLQPTPDMALHILNDDRFCRAGLRAKGRAGDGQTLSHHIIKGQAIGNAALNRDNDQPAICLQDANMCFQIAACDHIQNNIYPLAICFSGQSLFKILALIVKTGARAQFFYITAARIIACGCINFCPRLTGKLYRGCTNAACPAMNKNALGFFRCPRINKLPQTVM